MKTQKPSTEYLKKWYSKIIKAYKPELNQNEIKRPLTFDFDQYENYLIYKTKTYENI